MSSYPSALDSGLSSGRERNEQNGSKRGRDGDNSNYSRHNDRYEGHGRSDGRDRDSSRGRDARDYLNRRDTYSRDRERDRGRYRDDRRDSYGRDDRRGGGYRERERDRDHGGNDYRSHSMRERYGGRRGGHHKGKRQERLPANMIQKSNVVQMVPELAIAKELVTKLAGMYIYALLYCYKYNTTILLYIVVTSDNMCVIVIYL